MEAKTLLLQVGTLIKCQSAHHNQDVNTKLDEIKGLLVPELLAVSRGKTDLSQLKLDDFAALQIQGGELEPARSVQLQICTDVLIS